MVTLQHVFTLSCRMKRLVRDIADANISVTCMPITACTEFDVSKFWSMVMTVDPDMEEGEGGGGGVAWSEKERQHIAQSFKQRSLATLPLRFSSMAAAAALHGALLHLPRPS